MNLYFTKMEHVSCKTNKNSIPFDGPSGQSDFFILTLAKINIVLVYFSSVKRVPFLSQLISSVAYGKNFRGGKSILSAREDTL